jgi:hypothetical protein
MGSASRRCQRGSGGLEPRRADGECQRVAAMILAGTASMQPAASRMCCSMRLALDGRRPRCQRQVPSPALGHGLIGHRATRPLANLWSGQATRTSSRHRQLDDAEPPDGLGKKCSSRSPAHRLAFLHREHGQLANLSAVARHAHGHGGDRPTEPRCRAGAGCAVKHIGAWPGSLRRAAMRSTSASAAASCSTPLVASTGSPCAGEETFGASQAATPPTTGRRAAALKRTRPQAHQNGSSHRVELTPSSTPDSVGSDMSLAAFPVPPPVDQHADHHQHADHRSTRVPPDGDQR